MSLEYKFREMFPADVRAGFLIPTSVDELADMISDHPRLGIGGSDPYRLVPRGRSRQGEFDENRTFQAEAGPQPQLVDAPLHRILLDELKEVLWFSPENQLVCVQSGITLARLNEFLSEEGYEIPIGLRKSDQDACIGDVVSLNLPHWNMAQCGSWRDWVVKMRLVLASGEIIASGANVVKNVTGFDLHKLVIGARYTLGVPGEITLRIRPKSEPRDYPPIRLNHGVLVHTNREGLAVLRDHLHEWLFSQDDRHIIQHYFDEENGLALVETIFHRVTQQEFDHKRYGHIWRSDVGEYALAEFSDAEQKLMKRTKEIFDPTYKLNPGEFGFI